MDQLLIIIVTLIQFNRELNKINFALKYRGKVSKIKSIFIITFEIFGNKIANRLRILSGIYVLNQK
jgi:hypothetical protein